MTPGETRHLGTPEEQQALGAALAALVPPGGVVFLEGDLGTGKTTLTQGLVAALGFDGEVSSPTYALMQVYPARDGAVLHVDAYRVEHAAELYAMDLERLVEDSRLSVVEWGSLFYDDFPHAWLLRLDYAEGSGRSVTRVR
ncbi:tRNA (adenosine(37)-N6)-threonylcarbamoyltransferase complex ATPase subunit type 1 TsaE [Deinococcus pimensis]|uniref:tRNA (adenosine(37)-N6)-threonylcarbamoyltransferase complex ATPase subunit type 1 TsaE n=1 Tax=Deinococcus pimensis TaxID=309888 RepID=UPI00048831EE|nr:tRNA (adenosine(37)-N6)-threonylcarbamoyltransferase complex ATPase subunit type 1 TsaE [Deinococcus pimensis]